MTKIDYDISLKVKTKNFLSNFYYVNKLFYLIESVCYVCLFYRDNPLFGVPPFLICLFVFFRLFFCFVQLGLVVKSRDRLFMSSYESKSNGFYRKVTENNIQFFISVNGTTFELKGVRFIKSE